MFPFSFDKKMLYIVLAVMVVMNLANFSEAAIFSLLLTLPGVIIAITFHEFAHAYAASRLGDDTPRRQGRVTLNPIAHLDPFGTILLIFANIGWGKPVQINPRNFTRNVTMSKGEAIVSVAGPLMNFLLSIILGIILFAILVFAPEFSVLSSTGQIIMEILRIAVMVNIGLGVFNLIPLPPLDGSKIFRSVLPYKAKTWLDRNEKYFYIAFLIMWLVPGVASSIISPIINGIASGLFWVLGQIFSFFI